MPASRQFTLDDDSWEAPNPIVFAFDDACRIVVTPQGLPQAIQRGIERKAKEGSGFHGLTSVPEEIGPPLLYVDLLEQAKAKEDAQRCPGTAPPRTGASRLSTSRRSLDDAGLPPASALSRRSASSSQLLDARGATGRSSRLSRRSGLSQASLRSLVQEQVAQEVKRTALTDYLDLAKAKKTYEPAAALRRSCLNMGAPSNTNVATTAEALRLPVAMAVQPKWSTELKRINDKVGQRIQHDNSIAAAITGQLSPDVPHWPRRRHLSNPTTPLAVKSPVKKQ